MLATVPWLTAYLATVAAVQVVALAVIAALVARHLPPKKSPEQENEITVRHTVQAAGTRADIERGE